MTAPDAQRLAYLSDLAGYVADADLDAYKLQVSQSISGRALSSHTHGTGDISSGVLDPARLGLTAAGQVPYRNGAGATSAVGFSPLVTNSSLAQRGTDGTLAVATPTADTHAATKAYVDSRGTGGTGSPATTDAAALTTGYLAPERLNLTSANGVAVRSSAGALIQVLLSSTVVANTLAYRGTGGVLAVGTPTDDTHAVTKAYSDAATSALSGAVTTLGTALGNVYTKAQADTLIGTKVGVVLIPAGGQIPEGLAAGTIVLERKA